MLDVVKKYSSNVVSCGISFDLPLGTLFGSLLAFPLLGVENLLSYVSLTLSFWFTFIFLVVGLASLYIVSLTYDEIPLVMDKIIGLAIFYKHQPWSLKLMMTSFFLFHLLRAVIPFFVKKIVGHTVSFGTFIDIVWPSITAGLAGNFLLRFMVWVGH